MDTLDKVQLGLAAGRQIPGVDIGVGAAIPIVGNFVRSADWTKDAGKLLRRSSLVVHNA